MTKIYATDFKVWATVYIRAASPEEARQKAQVLTMDCLELDQMQTVNGIPLSGLPYDDPELPDVSIAPAMTIEATCIRELKPEDFEERS